MTGYYISVGYNSQHSPEEVWRELEMVMRELCANPKRIADEACAVGAPIEVGGENIYDYAERYQANDGIAILETSEGKHIAQTASGGGVSRILKEHLRRAFCRLVLAAMHGKGMEINITVS